MEGGPNNMSELDSDSDLMIVETGTGETAGKAAPAAPAAPAPQWAAIFKAEHQKPGRSGLSVTPRKSKIAQVKGLLDELDACVTTKNNLHKEVKDMIKRIQKVAIAAVKEHDTAVVRAERAEHALSTAQRALTGSQEKRAERKPTGVGNTPVISTPQTKRGRTSPGEVRPGGLKKLTTNGTPAPDGTPGGETRENTGTESTDAGLQEDEFTDVISRKERKKNRQNLQKFKKGEQKAKEKPPPRQKPPKTDAVLVKAKDASTYVELLKKIREDPELRDLGENMLRSRRTQKGEMLFELKEDPTVDSSTIQGLVAKSLGEQVEVKALCPEMVIECRDLDELTTVEELGGVLRSQCNLGEVEMTIRLRKAYGGTQTATIRLPVTAANKVLEVGKLSVGWSKCPLRAAPRVSKQAERCFKCFGFGHWAGACKGPDRSKNCWKCGDMGHLAKDCTQRPKCMLCTPEDGNDHQTGGYKCPAYKKATARRQ